MAAEKKNNKENPAYAAFKADIAAGNIANAYLFHGEESYLREYHLGQLRELLVPAGFEEFNYHKVEGKNITVQALAEMAESMPMMSERTLVEVTDMDLFRLNDEERTQLVALLEDLPPYCCIVFVYETMEYKPNATMKKLKAALETYVKIVEFKPADNSDLVPWIVRRFRPLREEIDRSTAEDLIFLCGGLMTGLVPEITKIAAYTKGKTVTVRDIDAVASPVLSAEAFKMADAVCKGNYDEAARLMGDLLKMQEDPIKINALLGSQLRRIYTACIAIDNGKDKYWLMDLWGMKSDFAVKLWISAAKSAGREWCADAVKQSQILDLRLKSERGIDDEAELKLLLVRLGAKRI